MRLFMTCVFCLFAVAGYTSDMRVSVSEVKDTRTTGQFSQMELKLKVMGDIISDAKGVKLKITKALDDTDRNLLKEEGDKTDFTLPDEHNIGQAEVEAKLKNPARRAAVIKELLGEITVFVPKTDPNATANINNFMNAAGKPLNNAALKAAQVEIAVLTKSQYNEIKEKKKQEVKEKEGSLVEEFGEAIVQALSSLFGGMMEIGENSVILSIKDTESKVAAIEFMDKSGKRITSNSTMRMGDIWVFDFEKPMPQDAQLAIFIITPKSVIKSPFKLTDIALP
ncbi:MAG: hypothetical protein AB1638_00675 [Nitrospirota bacterium]